MIARIATIVLALTLTACGTTTIRPVPSSGRATPGEQTPAPETKPAPPATATRGGGYYKDDGPGENPPVDLEAIPDVVPKAEPLHRFANKPYSVLGRDYTPLLVPGKYKARGRASWYGKKFHGQKTSTGETYDMYAMSAAHPTLPLPSYARVTNLANGKSVVVRVNDRGPFHTGRIVDLSWTAAAKLGYVGQGSTMVEVESLAPGAPIELATNSSTSTTNAMNVTNATNTPTAPSVTTSEPAKNLADASSGPQVLPEIDDARGAWLQLGAFGNRDNAEALKSRLSRELGDLGNKLVVRATGNLFRVQLGPWADAKEASNIALTLADLLEIKPVVVQK